MQAGKTILHKVNFIPHEIISDAIQLLQQSAERKNIKLNYSPNIETLTVAGDPGRFRQILLNLLNNAIKYTEQGEVTIATSLKIIDNRRIRLTISISDTGVGMSPDFLNKVFDEFERADIVVDKTESGSGLGLAITKKLIDIHRGKISLQSTEGKGTTVKVVLPYHVGGSNDESKLPVATNLKKINSLRFLVVDDVEYNRKLIGTILKRNNAYYQEAKNGQEAIDMLNRKNFDIILMDIRMPLIDGITATKVIKKTDENVQIIALTASSSEKEKKEYTEAGIKRILLKPISESELLTAISEVSVNTIIQTNENKVGNTDKFSLDELWNLCQPDKTFFNEMLDSFIKTSKDTIDLMNIALKETDLKQLSFLAHRLSGPAKHIGTAKLLGYLKTLDDNSEKDLSLEDLKELLLSTEKEVGEIIQFISNSRHKY